MTGGDDCSATCQVEAGCPPTPESGCRLPTTSAKSQFQIADKSPDSKDRLQWKWAQGAATTMADFGTPLTTTSCVRSAMESGVVIRRV
jgi:hypothetical protein